MSLDKMSRVKLIVNTWAYTLGDEPGAFNREFPYKAQDIKSGDWLTIKSQDDVWSAIVSCDPDFYEGAIFIASPSALVDEESRKLLKRFYYCKRYGVAPYPGTYNDQPKEWIEASETIELEARKANKYHGLQIKAMQAAKKAVKNHQHKENN